MFKSSILSGYSDDITISSSTFVTISRSTKSPQFDPYTLLCFAAAIKIGVSKDENKESNIRQVLQSVSKMEHGCYSFQQLWNDLSTKATDKAGMLANWVLQS